MKDLQLSQFIQSTFNAFIAEINLKIIPELSKSEIKQEISSFTSKYAAENNYLLRHYEHNEVVEHILDSIVGMGPLEKLLNDPEVTDILVNGAKDIYVERRGKLEKSTVEFNDNQHALQICQKIINKMAGRRIDESSPLADARLPDGSRVNLIIPPVALNGPCISIRKFSKNFIHLDQMVTTKNLSEDMSAFFKLIASCRLNTFISGGTGSGKTTLMNALSEHMNKHERIITIEDAAELKIPLPHVLRLESRPSNLEGEGEITIRELVKNALRMRPDRIIVGECRGQEAFDMMQAMNTGHDGSMSTLHANSPLEAIDRVQNMILMANLGLPSEAILGFIADAIDIIIQISRMRDGIRRVTSVYEVGSLTEKGVELRKLFEFRYEGEDSKGNLKGKFVKVHRPEFTKNKFETAGKGKEIQSIFRKKA